MRVVQGARWRHMRACVKCMGEVNEKVRTIVSLR